MKMFVPYLKKRILQLNTLILSDASEVECSIILQKIALLSYTHFAPTIVIIVFAKRVFCSQQILL